MNSLFDDLGWRSGHIAEWAPTVDIFERPAELVIVVEMPGVDREDVRIAWKDGVLSILGVKRRRPADAETCRYLCVERAYGQFRRDIAITIPVDFGQAHSDLREGLLRIRIPKSDHASEIVIPVE